MHIDGKSLRISDCEINEAGGNGITLEACDGEVTHTTIIAAADNALYTNDCRGLLITANTIRGSGNGGIRVWQSSKRHDGSIVADNSIEDTRARDGGSGENGNAINVYRAAGVIVRGNHIRNAAFSAIRGNAASNIQIIGNKCAGLDEVAIYSEFDFEGAVIADNVIDTAESGISVDQFQRRRPACHGARQCHAQSASAAPDQPPEESASASASRPTPPLPAMSSRTRRSPASAPAGANICATSTVTGNVVRDARHWRRSLGRAKAPASPPLPATYWPARRRGAIVGMEWHKAVTGDLALAGAEHYPQLKISGNQVS